MPELARFYGIIIRMYAYDDQRHHAPHIHACYQDEEASLSIPEGILLAGGLPGSQMKRVQEWIELHEADLLENWERAVRGERTNKIDPLP